jgi:DNA topoisomerase-1
MALKQGRFGPFLSCTGYPKCKNTRPLATGVPCPKEGCEGKLVERRGKFKRPFLGCSRYPECTFSFWGKLVQESCAICGFSVMLEKQTKKDGPSRICPNPDCVASQSREPEENSGAGGR